MAKTAESVAKPRKTSSPDPPVQPEAPARLFEMVAGAAAAVACELDGARLVEVILEQMQLLGAIVTVVFAADVMRRELTLLGQRALPPDIVKRIERVPFDAPLVSARAATTSEPQLVENPESLEPTMTLAGEVLRRTETMSVLAVPLMVAGRLIGVLTTAHAEARRFPPEEIAAIRAIADVFAASLKTARAHQRDRLQLESLHVAALAISAPIALPSVLQNIVDHARALAGASYAALGILDAEAPDGPFNPWVFSGLNEREAAFLGRFPRPIGLLGAVAREGRTIRLRNLVEDTRFHGFPPNHPRMMSFLGVPVFYLDRVVGNLYLTNKRDADEFSDDDQRVVEMFAQHASIAVEHAREHEVLVREVVQHKHDQEALRASEERFRRMAENAPDVICRYRLVPFPAVEYVSPAVYGVLGHRPRDYYRDPALFCKQIHPFDRPLLEAVSRAPDSFTGPLLLRWIHPSGRLVWTESRVVPLGDETGKVAALESITRDVTDRKRAESEIERLMDRLRGHEAWLQAVIENSPVAIILVEDPWGRRITANRAAESLFGRPLQSDGGIEQYLDQLHDPRGAPLVRGGLLVTRALHGETVSGQELLCRRPDGRDVPVLVSAAPVRHEPEGIFGAVVVYKDISELKELEHLRNEWTSIIAHDLRQPVQAIASLTGMLAKGVTDPALKAKVERILSAVDQLTRMIADLLDVSRIDVRELPLRLETVDIIALAHDVVERMGEELAGRPVRVEARREIPPIQADTLRLGEVLTNLLSNAAKYGHPDTAIDVELEVKDGEVFVSVTNQGQGILPEEIPKLFERFRRTEGAARGTTRGVGLGLYIARGLVEAHGGRMWVESVPGRTTTFRFTLPTQRAVEGRDAA